MSITGQQFLSDECREIVETAAVQDGPPMFDPHKQPVTRWALIYWSASARDWLIHRPLHAGHSNAVMEAEQLIKEGTQEVRVFKIDLE